MEVSSGPQISTSVTLNLPAHMTLPVSKDKDGFTVPSTGFVWQKYLNYETLEALGVSIDWRNPDGSILPAEEAKALIEQAMQREAQAQAANDPQAVSQA